MKNRARRSQELRMRCSRTVRGKLIIVDFKTSKITTGQQKLMPLYELQLNAYAHCQA